MCDRDDDQKLRYMDTIRIYTKKDGLADVNILARNDWRLVENGSIKGDPLIWKSLQGEKVRR